MEARYTDEQLADLLKQVRSGQLSGESLFDALHAFGEYQFLEARAVVEEHLTHSDDGIRYMALSVLVLHWGLEDHRSTCEHFLFADPSPYNRGLGASCLGSLLRCTEDAKALRMLLAVFHNNAEEQLVRASAYDAILDILCVPWGERPSAAKPLTDEKIDWERLRDVERRLYDDE